MDPARLAGHFLSLAGLIIGLGAVTVIDLHGFLGRRSPYWTEATIRAHKITKPLIWLGIALLSFGSWMLYADGSWTDYALLRAAIIAMLILNGCFLTFWVSPRLLERERRGKAAEILPDAWQRAIAASFLVSVAGWWSIVALFALRIAR